MQRKEKRRTKHNAFFSPGPFHDSTMLLLSFRPKKISRCSLHLGLREEDVLVDAGVILPELELLRDPARVLALHVEEPRAGGRHEPDEDGRPLRLPHFRRNGTTATTKTGLLSPGERSCQKDARIRDLRSVHCTVRIVHFSFKGGMIWERGAAYEAIGFDSRSRPQRHFPSPVLSGAAARVLARKQGKLVGMGRPGVTFDRWAGL